MNITKIHFIGIGGIGMSGLARLYLHERASVSGSDAVQTDNTDRLKTEGVQVVYEQVPENITNDLDLVVYTEAMPHDHPELVAAREKSIRTVNYFEALGEVANQYYLIAVAGTHGKTTTTAMLADILEAAEMDPTVIVGSLRTKTNSNFRPGKSKYFIVEACEYRRDFLTLTPDLLVITNLEHEHVDYYQDLAAVQTAFGELVERVNDGGVVVTNTANQNIVPVLQREDLTVSNYKDQLDLSLTLKQPGVHNYMNAAAAAAAARQLGIEKEVITAALENFTGTKRRFEYKGAVNGASVYDDYAHHPTEIAAAIAGARDACPGYRLTVIFQPHTYSRTQGLFNEFAKSFSGADRVFLLPIYAAREEVAHGVSSRELAVATLEYCPETTYIDSFEDVVHSVSELVSDNDVVLVLGAGDVTKVADQLVSV